MGASGRTPDAELQDLTTNSITHGQATASDSALQTNCNTVGAIYNNPTINNYFGALSVQPSRSLPFERPVPTTGTSQPDLSLRGPNPLHENEPPTRSGSPEHRQAHRERRDSDEAYTNHAGDQTEGSGRQRRRRTSKKKIALIIFVVGVCISGVIVGVVVPLTRKKASNSSPLITSSIQTATASFNSTQESSFSTTSSSATQSELKTENIPIGSSSTAPSMNAAKTTFSTHTAAASTTSCTSNCFPSTTASSKLPNTPTSTNPPSTTSISSTLLTTTKPQQVTCAIDANCPINLVCIYSAWTCGTCIE
ncbi:uncharacterized protein PAC_18637 [Phialocephala subalpina]|uniref:Uncharacterized protein n=1 Tax=Phialocephala subalpina TaxID=576137 RepID=A0A1L7XUM7_9HELO|nr:uncharacterized protein PAC_18637 [Phialocephala subalpina]